MAAVEQMMDDNFNFIASTCCTKAAIDDTNSADCKITLGQQLSQAESFPPPRNPHHHSFDPLLHQGR